MTSAGIVGARQLRRGIGPVAQALNRPRDALGAVGLDHRAHVRAPAPDRGSLGRRAQQLGHHLVGDAGDALGRHQVQHLLPAVPRLRRVRAALGVGQDDALHARRVQPQIGEHGVPAHRQAAEHEVPQAQMVGQVVEVVREVVDAGPPGVVRRSAKALPGRARPRATRRARPEAVAATSPPPAGRHAATPACGRHWPRRPRAIASSGRRWRCVCSRTIPSLYGQGCKERHHFATAVIDDRPPWRLVNACHVPVCSCSC